MIVLFCFVIALFIISSSFSDSVRLFVCVEVLRPSQPDVCKAVLGDCGLC